MARARWMRTVPVHCAFGQPNVCWTRTNRAPSVHGRGNKTRMRMTVIVATESVRMDRNRRCNDASCQNVRRKSSHKCATGYFDIDAIKWALDTDDDADAAVTSPVTPQLFNADGQNIADRCYYFIFVVGLRLHRTLLPHSLLVVTAATPRDHLHHTNPH